MAGKSEVLVRFIGDTASLDRALKSTHAKLGELGKLSVAAGLAIAGGMAAAAVGSLKAADKFEASQAKLQAAVEASGGSWAANKDQIDKTSTSMEKYGFTASQVEDAMARAVISTGSLSKATNRLQLAADLAKAKNMDLGSAMDMVDKAANGQLRPIKALGIDLPVAAGGALKLQQASAKLATAQQAVKDLLAQYPDALDAASKHHAVYQKAVEKVTAAQGNLKTLQGESTVILDALSTKLSGQAAAAADTFGGKVEALKAKSEDLGVKLGLALVPALTKVLNVIVPMVSWFGNLPGPMQAVAVGMLAVGSAALILIPKVLALKDALAKKGLAGAAEESTGMLGKMTSFVTGPWGAAIGGAALVAIPLLIKAFQQHGGMVKWDTTQLGFNSAAIKTNMDLQLKQAIESNPKLVAAMNATGITFDQLTAAIDGNKAAHDQLITRLQTTADQADILGHKVGRVGGAAQGYSDLRASAQGLIDTINGGASTWDKQIAQAQALNTALNGVNTATKIAGLAPGQGSGGAGRTPRYASGTSYHPGGLAVVGEQGPELVDLPRGSKVYPNGSGAGARGVGGGGSTIIINAPGIMAGPTLEVARYLRTLIQNAQHSGLDFGVPQT